LTFNDQRAQWDYESHRKESIMSGLMKNSYFDNPGLGILPGGNLTEDRGNGGAGQARVIFPEDTHTTPLTVKETSFRNPIYSGLFAGKHYQKMGQAIWAFGCLIDWTTSEYADEDRVRWGKVLGGQPITYEMIAARLGIYWRTAKKYMDRLKRGSYVRIKQHSRGLIVEIRNSRKFLFRVTQTCQSKFQDDTNVSVIEPQSKSKDDTIRSPDLPKRVSHFPGSPHQSKVSLRDKKRHIKDKYIYVPGSKPLELATLLKDLILERKPDYRWGVRAEPNLQEWARQIDLMHRNDGRDFEKIERVIRWSQEDGFWAKNICSTDKLRRQFSRLEDQMEGSKSITRKTDGPKYVVEGD
jgi:hypothetical protein